MPLPSSGPLSLNNIQTEFGGTNPISISEYYAGGAFVPAGTSGTNGPVPSSGAISISNFYGTTAFIPFGEAVYTTSGTYSFTVPAGITEISAVAVGGGSVIGYNGSAPIGNTRVSTGGAGLSYTNAIPVTPGETLTVVAGTQGIKLGANPANPATASSISRGGTTLLRAAQSFVTMSGTTFISTTPGLASDGVGAVRYSGGIGRASPAASSITGAGGAAGYAGDGGNGGGASTAGTSGQGGGGGGGGGANSTTGSTLGGGGGVGIYGQGASGAGGGAGGLRGTTGSGGPPPPAGNRDAGFYGGGAGTDPDSPLNNTVLGSGGAVRIIWGTGKSYPNNAN